MMGEVLATAVPTSLGSSLSPSSALVRNLNVRGEILDAALKFSADGIPAEIAAPVESSVRGPVSFTSTRPVVTAISGAAGADGIPDSAAN
jgi:hypothetical protein